jgi:lysozyme
MQLNYARSFLRSLRRQLGAFSGNARIAVAALSLSAAGLVAIVNHESFVGEAMIPTQGDVPTLGFGSTTHEDGSPVRLGERTTPVKALNRSLAYLQDAEAEMKQTLEGVSLTQGEYDLYLDWRYQYGAAAWRKSGMLRELRAGHYEAACDALLLYKFSQGRDCSNPANWGPRGCKGVWTRSQQRNIKCMTEQGS